MRLLFPVCLSAALGQISSVSNADFFKDDPLPLDMDITSPDNISLWDLPNNSEIAQISTNPTEIELDSDHSLLSPLTAESHSSSCYWESNWQNSKMRRRELKTCPAGQRRNPWKNVETPTPELPDILDQPEEKSTLKFSIPKIDLNFDRPKCKHDTFVTHLCCDGPAEMWRDEGFFGSVKKCWPCTRILISLEISFAQLS
jgi:hypothetical protein